MEVTVPEPSSIVVPRREIKTSSEDGVEERDEKSRSVGVPRRSLE